ncbi:MAG: 2-C-methyl-D-erythritol 4-phosphate cytidylyltransferase [Lachnospiraceae bacterium]
MTAGERNLSRRVAAILLAGGSGTRFGADKNKVYVEALGQPLIRYSLDVFAAHPLVDEVILVAREGEKKRSLNPFPVENPAVS